jgi:hypothetical protein
MKNARFDTGRRKTAMGKMFLSLGFWMTILLFVALGYAMNSAWGSECPEGVSCGYTRTTLASTDFSDFSDENRQFENSSVASDVARRRCPANATANSHYLDFQQMASLQAGGPVYAPGLSLTFSRRPTETTLCPGPIEIPRH